MKKPAYFWHALFLLLVGLPLLFQLFILLLLGLLILGELLAFSDPIFALTGGIALGGVFLYLCGLAGWHTVLHHYEQGQKNDTAQAAPVLPRQFSTRYLPVLIALAYTLFFAAVGLLWPGDYDHASFRAFENIFVLTHLPGSFLGSGLLMLIHSPWVLLLPPLAIYAAYGSGLAWGFRCLGAPPVPRQALWQCGGVLVAVFAALVWRIEVMSANLLPGTGWIAAPPRTRHYRPFSPGNLLAPVENPSLAFVENPPRLDGATAMYPVYAAAAQAIYKGLDQYRIAQIVTSSTTPFAYENLLSGEADVIFALQPSEEQLAAAAARGVAYEMTPLGRDAFVFFVHKDNPVSGLSSGQVRDIYTKRIRNWRDAGGVDLRIMPFQRPEGSGSQTAMEKLVMKGAPLAAPLREEFVRGMGGIIQSVATYRDTDAAIGYSFRVFATKMSATPDIKLLAIDGIAPTPENIRSGKYPYTADFYAITAGGATPNVRRLIDWFLGPQGQKLIEDTGYIGIQPDA